MTAADTAASIIAAMDVDQVTDLIGIPLAALVVGLLVLIDLVGLDDAAPSTIPGFLTRRRTLVVAAVVAGTAFAALIVLRVTWLTA